MADKGSSNVKRIGVLDGEGRTEIGRIVIEKADHTEDWYDFQASDGVETGEANTVFLTMDTAEMTRLRDALTQLLED
jgi:hypothetical protein